MRAKGFALLTSMLFMALLAIFSVGMIYVVQTEARMAGTEMVSVEAYYAAAAAMDKMVVDLNDLYSTQSEPSVTNIEALGGASYEPSLTGVSFSDYSLTVPNTSGSMDFEVRMVESGPNQGLMADVNTMTLSVQASSSGGDVLTMTRNVQLARIPVFQFGVFSDGDLSYYSSDTFNMAGRVHTNGNLFLASGDSTTGLVFHSRITAVGEVIRQELANGESTSPTFLQPVLIPTAPNGCQGSRPACRDQAETEGSKTAGPSSSDNSAWTNLSESIYNGMILNGDTGAKALSLRFVTPSLRPIELIRRPPSGESTSSLVSQSRLYNQAQIRLLLSDSASELPGGTGVRLANVFPYYFFGIYGGTNTAFAEDAGNPLIDGYLLVQRRLTDGSYANVTAEWLNLGIARENANALLKFQVFHDHEPDGVIDHPDNANNRSNPDLFYPLNLYDSREGEVRDASGPSDCALGGIINIVELDVLNLRRWLLGTIGSTGTQVESTSQNGYLLYFSDQRGMLADGGGNKLGYGYEDIINPTVSTGAPDGSLAPSEDVNQNGTLETYGAGNLGNGFGVSNGDPTLRIDCNSKGFKMRVSGARHGLKLVNGSLGNLPTPGFTVGSENPVYVQGHYNADNSGFGDPHAAAAIIADAVTFLSRSWADWQSFQYPTTAASRNGNSTWYRVAVVSGKNLSWPWPSAWAGTNKDYGLDGGAHSFLRYLEDWGGTFHYQGSLVSLYTSEYATGIYKCCATVFQLSSPDYTFDTDFLDSTKLPPATPRLQDLVTLGFRQVF